MGMGLRDDVWEKFRRGELPETDATILEVMCSVGRQLAYRLEKLIDVIERGPDDGIATLFGPGAVATPIGQMIQLMRLSMASYPRNHATVSVTAAGIVMISNPHPYTIPVMITNLDNAQFLFYGSSPASILTSPLIDPESKEKINVSPNSDLYGIVAGAAINVAVSLLDLPTV